MIKRLLKILTCPIWFPLMAIIFVVELFAEVIYIGYWWVLTGEEKHTTTFWMRSIWKFVWNE